MPPAVALLSSGQTLYPGVQISCSAAGMCSKYQIGAQHIVAQWGTGNEQTLRNFMYWEKKAAESSFQTKIMCQTNYAIVKQKTFGNTS